MLIDMPGAFKAFSELSDAELFLTFIGKSPTFAMKIKTKTTRLDAVLELHREGAGMRIVDSAAFLNRNVFVPKDASFRFSELSRVKTGHPDTFAFGSAILSPEGTFVRAAHTDGPFDVDVENGIAVLTKNHEGSMYFDSWDVIVKRGGESEVLFSHLPPVA